MRVFNKINRVFKKLKLQVKFTNEVIEFKPTFKGHSIVTYLNHAFTKDVISTQNQCQIWIYTVLKSTCCVQLNIVLSDRINLNCTEILKQIPKITAAMENLYIFE